MERKLPRERNTEYGITQHPVKREHMMEFMGKVPSNGHSKMTPTYRHKDSMFGIYQSTLDAFSIRKSSTKEFHWIRFCWQAQIILRFSGVPMCLNVCIFEIPNSVAITHFILYKNIKNSIACFETFSWLVLRRHVFRIRIYENGICSSVFMTHYQFLCWWHISFLI